VIDFLVDLQTAKNMTDNAGFPQSVVWRVERAYGTAMVMYLSVETAQCGFAEVLRMSGSAVLYNIGILPLVRCSRDEVRQFVGRVLHRRFDTPLRA